MRKRRFLYSIITLVSAVAAVGFSSCKGKEDSSFEQKPITGVAAMFDESLG